MERYSPQEGLILEKSVDGNRSHHFKRNREYKGENLDVENMIANLPFKSAEN
jgi:hypothetical protein